MTTQLPSIDVIVNPEPVAQTWRTLPRELEEAGFHGVVCPDNPWSADPFQILAIAASVTTTLRLGTHVLAAPLREPWQVAGQARSLAALSGGRVGIGLGTGLPQIHQVAERAGRPAMNGAASRRWIAATAAALRTPEQAGAPSVTVAAGGPRTMAVAAGVADEVALPLAPTATRADVEQMVHTVNSLAQQNNRRVTYVVNAIGVGDRLVGFLARGSTAEELRAAGAFALLPADTAQLAETLSSWRAGLGIERIVVSEELRDDFAEVLRPA